MRLLRLAGVSLVLLPLCPGAIAAQTFVPTPIKLPTLAIAFRFGTPGFGAEINKLLTGHLGVRAGLNYFSLNRNHTETGIDYAIKFKLHSLMGLVDLYPKSHGSFHLTGGITTNPATVSATGLPSLTGDFVINNNTYTTAQVGTLTGEAKFSDVVPYFGLGFGTPYHRHGSIRFLFDIGAAIGTADVTLTATGAAGNPTLQSDLQAQISKTRDDVRKYAKLYPVISFGLAYTL